MNNPFEILSAKLNGIDILIQQALQHSALPSIAEVGGLELVQEVTRLSKT